MYKQIEIALSFTQSCEWKGDMHFFQNVESVNMSKMYGRDILDIFPRQQEAKAGTCLN